MKKNCARHLIITGFFIFFDAKPVPCDKNAQKSIEKYAPDGYGIFSDNNWSMGHINQKTFNPSTPNVLLKSVEEPPERTTFVFLTKKPLGFNKYNSFTLPVL